MVSPELLVSGTPPFDKNNPNEWENALTNAVLRMWGQAMFLVLREETKNMPDPQGM